MKNNNQFKDLNRLLDKQNFKSEKDLKEFMNSIMLKPIPETPGEELTKEERAQDLVEEAYTLPVRDAFRSAELALKLNPDCIEAYEFFASRQISVESASSYYQDGIKIGRRIFGGEYLKNNKGHFWELHETRPFMRCLYEYAICLYLSGKKNECVSVLEEMIELNPNDNQGARDQLMLYLIELNEFDKYRKYSKVYDEDGGVFHYFNKALYSFKMEGESENSNRMLETAINENKFVLPILVSSKLQTEIPDEYIIGSKDEAKHYAAYAQRIWQQTPGAIKWMMKYRLRSK